MTEFVEDHFVPEIFAKKLHWHQHFGLQLSLFSSVSKQSSKRLASTLDLKTGISSPHPGRVQPLLFFFFLTAGNLKIKRNSCNGIKTCRLRCGWRDSGEGRPEKNSHFHSISFLISSTTIFRIFFTSVDPNFDTRGSQAGGRECWQSHESRVRKRSEKA